MELKPDWTLQPAWIKRLNIRLNESFPDHYCPTCGGDNIDRRYAWGTSELMGLDTFTGVFVRPTDMYFEWVECGDCDTQWSPLIERWYARLTCAAYAAIFTKPPPRASISRVDVYD